MKIEITKNPIKKIKKTTNVYKITTEYVDISTNSVREIRNVETLIDYIKITEKYIQLLSENHDDWCTIEPDMILKAAKLAGVKMDEDGDRHYDFFVPHPDYSDYMTRPKAYKITYVGENGTEFECKVT